MAAENLQDHPENHRHNEKTVASIAVKISPKKQIIVALIALMVGYLMGYFMLKGAGLRYAFFYTMPLVLLYALCSGSRKIFWFFLFPFTLIYALYAPIGFTFGKLSYDFLIAGISTDMIEAKEFMQLIPYRNFLIPPLILGCLFLFWWLVRNYQLHFYRNKTFLFIALLIMLIGQSPMIFIQQIRDGSTAYYREQQALNNLVEANEWGESLLSHHSLYDNYILVIGESARKDYHHAYGYPINNTPFMSRENGILIDGLTAGGTYTVPSLKAMLTLSDKVSWEADYTKTLIGLAQSAGIKSYWLSNQGYFGTFDTPISALATSSDEKKFMKFGDSGTANTSDFELLKYLEEIIASNPHEKKLIVLHLYGSHHDACQRIEDYSLLQKVEDPAYDYINCYISSLHKTDHLLEQVNQMMQVALQEEGATYSLLYFADHGQTLFEQDGQYMLGNRDGYYQFEIPLFMTSSDAKARKECQSFKSGVNFLNGLASWMGVQNPHLDPNYSLFDCQDDPDDYGLSHKLQQREESRINDRPIDLRGK